MSRLFRESHKLASYRCCAAPACSVNNEFSWVCPLGEMLDKKEKRLLKGV